MKVNKPKLIAFIFSAALLSQDSCHDLWTKMDKECFSNSKISTMQKLSKDKHCSGLIDLWNKSNCTQEFMRIKPIK